MRGGGTDMVRGWVTRGGVVSKKSQRARPQKKDKANEAKGSTRKVRFVHTHADGCWEMGEPNRVGRTRVLAGCAGCAAVVSVSALRKKCFFWAKIYLLKSCCVVACVGLLCVLCGGVCSAKNRKKGGVCGGVCSAKKRKKRRSVRSRSRSLSCRFRCSWGRRLH